MSYNFNENWYLEDFRPEECDSDKCDLKMVAIVAIMVTILKIAAKMATIMAEMATIFKSHLSLSHSSGRKSSKYQFSLIL